MNRIFKVLFFIILFILSINLIAEEKLSFTLKDAQDYALQNSYVLKNSNYEVEKAKAKVRETIAIGLPQISSYFNYNNNLSLATNVIEFNGERIMMKFGTKYNSDYGIRISQLIFNGSYIVGVKASNAWKKISGLSKEKMELEVKEAVAKSYYFILALEDNLCTLGQILKDNEKNFKEAKAYYKNGFIEELDVEQFELMVKKSENQLSDTKRNIKNSRIFLNYLMGIPIEKEIVLKENLEDFLITEKDKQSFEVDTNIDFKIADNNVRIMKLNLKNEYASFLPVISANFNWQKSSMTDYANIFKSGTDWYKSSNISLSVQLPLFSSGSRSSKVTQAKLDFLKAENDRNLVREKLKKDYTQAQALLENSEEKFENNKKSRDLALRIYKKTLIKYQNGLSSSSELTQNNIQYLQAQSLYISSMLDYLNSRLNIKKILGVL